MVHRNFIRTDEMTKLRFRSRRSGHGEHNVSSAAQNPRALMTCPSCNSELPSPKFNFCPSCGAATAQSNKPARELTHDAIERGAADTIAEPAAAVSSAGPATLFGRSPARVLGSDTPPEPAPAIRTTGEASVPARSSSRVDSAKAGSAKADKPERTTSRFGRATIVDPRHARPDSEAATVLEMPSIDAATLEKAAEMKLRGSQAGLAGPVRTDELNSALLEGSIRAAPRIRDDSRDTVLNLAAVTGFEETRDHPAVSVAEAPSSRSASPATSPEALTSSAAAKIHAKATAGSPTAGTATGSATARPSGWTRVSAPQSASAGTSTGPKVGYAEPSSAVGDRKKFSETAWFMAAVNPAELTDREGTAQGVTEADHMTERYAVDEPLPDEVRSKFSLST
jgi:hypothetical protein